MLAGVPVAYAADTAASVPPSSTVEELVVTASKRKRTSRTCQPL